jgi:hypothetical protein
MTAKFWLGNLKEMLSGDIGAGRRKNIKKDFRDETCEDAAWIHVAEHKDLWWVIVKTVNELFP